MLVSISTTLTQRKRPNKIDEEEHRVLVDVDSQVGQVHEKSVLINVFLWIWSGFHQFDIDHVGRVSFWIPPGCKLMKEFVYS